MTPILVTFFSTMICFFSGLPFLMFPFGGWSFALCMFFSKQPFWINPIHRIIFDIGIEVESTIKADGVGREVATSLWGVVPVPVVVEAGLGVEVLARETQVVRNRTDPQLGFAKGQGSRLPDHRALSIHQLLRGAQVIVDVEYSPGRSSYSRKARGSFSSHTYIHKRKQQRAFAAVFSQGYRLSQDHGSNGR